MFRGKNIQLYKNKIAQLIIDFTFDLLRIAVITPMIIFFAVIIFIIIVFIQEKINPELSVSIIKFLFGEKTHSVEFFYEGDIMIIYRRCALIFFLIVGIISHFLHKKFELNFRKKMMIAVCLIFIGYGYVFTLSLTHKGLFSASFIPMMSIITLIASFFGIGASAILNKIQKTITRKIEK